MPLAVFLTDDAAGDLDELYESIVLNDAPGKADYVLERIGKAFFSLSESLE